MAQRPKPKTVRSLSNMAKKKVRKVLTRDIKRDVEAQLWGRAAGRCQFEGCNRIVFRSPVTQESVNIAEKAHIYAFSEKGARGWGPFRIKPKELNEVGNLMLVCHDCHKKIDHDKDGERYSADLLNDWKRKHERRVEIVSGVAQDKHSMVVLYGANIGAEKSLLQPLAANEALFPDWYPAQEYPIELSMKWEGGDRDPKFWEIEAENLEQLFNSQIRPLIKDQHCQHFSLFGFAPMPLLVKFGALFTDKIPAQVYNLHKEPESSWKWRTAPDVAFKVIQPSSFEHAPALVISITASISPDRIRKVIGENVAIWEVTVDNPGHAVLNSKANLAAFCSKAREAIITIAQKHGQNTPVAIFPAMPVACAVALGRVRMPKADSEWVIYDQQNAHNGFIRALTIGERPHAR